VAPVSVADTVKRANGRTVVELASAQTPVDGGRHVRVAVGRDRNVGAVGGRYRRHVRHQRRAEHRCNTHTHTCPFNGPFSGTTRVSRYQKGKTNLNFTEARDSEWQWHQLGRMQVSISLQTDNHASTPPLSFFTDRMPFLPPNQQRQSTEGSNTKGTAATVLS